MQHLNFILLLICTKVYSRIVKDDSEFHRETMNYIEKYEDDMDTDSIMQNPKMMKKYIAAFQRTWKIKGDGEMNEETLRLMRTPRCGMRDSFVAREMEIMESEMEIMEREDGKRSKNASSEEIQRTKRFILQGSRWDTNDVTYSVPQNRHPNLSKRDIKRSLADAARMWSEVSALNIRETSDPRNANIAAEFKRGAHGDGDPFDGPSGTLAHAFFPQFGGNLHYDDAERFTVDSFRGVSFMQTTLHELGHALGIAHSNVRDSVMFPFLRPYDSDDSLRPDDIAAIQTLYPPSTNNQNSTSRPRGTKKRRKNKKGQRNARNLINLLSLFL